MRDRPQMKQEMVDKSDKECNTLLNFSTDFNREECRSNAPFLLMTTKENGVDITNQR
jgi:hypothetical protein